MFDPDTDTYAYWMGYMIQTVKDAARRTHDKSCVDALRVFVETSRLAQPNDLEALNKALGDDDPLYEGNREYADKSAGLEAQDVFFRQTPDTPALRLGGMFRCEPDPSCGQDGAA